MMTASINNLNILCLFAVTDGFGLIIRYIKNLIGLPTENILDLDKETNKIIRNIQNEVNEEIKKEIDN